MHTGACTGSGTADQVQVPRLLLGRASVPLPAPVPLFNCLHPSPRLALDMRRGKFMNTVASFWMVGSLYSACTGWLIITRVGWRVFVLVASLPAWTVVVLVLAFIPETPRYLLVKGQMYKATQVHGANAPPCFSSWR